MHTIKAVTLFHKIFFHCIFHLRFIDYKIYTKEEDNFNKWNGDN